MRLTFPFIFIDLLVIFICIGRTSAGLFDSFKSMTYCKFVECCNSENIPYDIAYLKYGLQRKVFGQPLVSELVHILRAHKASIVSKGNIHKAEVISFHGWTGVGKNYVATIIAEALYKKGMDSNFVLMFQGQKAIDSGNLGKSRDNLLRQIESVVRACPTSLIIFDEVNEMDPLILDRIKFMLDHHGPINGVDYSKSLFIFISNIAGEEITNQLLNLYSQGVVRDELEFHNFEPIIRKTSYFQGGFNKAAIITKNLIDHYIPFLPLEQSHVEQCANSLFKAHGVTPTPEMWQDALSVITYGPTEDQPIFSNSGCKRLTKQIPYVIEKHSNKNYEL